MSVLVESAVKVSVILVAGLAVAAALRRHSAAARHWVLTLAILIALGAPALALIVPSWNVQSEWLAPIELRTSTDVTTSTAFEIDSAASSSDPRIPSDRFRTAPQIVW